MRRIALISLAALFPLSALHAAGSKQSTIVDMTRQTGPSKFVTSTDGKPVELGAPGRGGPDIVPEVIEVIRPEATALEPPQKQGSNGQQQTSQRADQVPTDQQPASRRPGDPSANQPSIGELPAEFRDQFGD